MDVVINVFTLWVLVGKLLPYCWRRPLALLYVPPYLIFICFPAHIRFLAMLTFWLVRWLRRNAAKINQVGSNLKAAISDAKSAQTQDFNPAPDYECFTDRSEDESVDPPLTPTRPIWETSTKPHWSTLRPVGTPWGFVAPVNLHRTPANVLQSQIAGRSWPADWSERKIRAYQDPGYQGEHSPVALQFEENLASFPPFSYPTPESSHNPWMAVAPASTQITPLTPPATPCPTPPFRTLSTPSRTPNTPSRSWVRVDKCGRIHECPQPRRWCGY